jgi:hypothetical protein
MNYPDIYKRLRSTFDFHAERIPYPQLDMEIVNLEFHSAGHCLLPGEKEYSCAEHGAVFKNPYRGAAMPGDIPTSPALKDLMKVDDSRIEENISFTYPVLRPVKANGKNRDRAKRVIVLFHGLNEKSWDKYLPWAYRLVELTGKPVILFPMAFHMNRAPAAWSEPRVMAAVSREKRRRFPSTQGSSLANAAINMRLQLLPQRFLWSGLQSYFDVLQLVKEIQNGSHPLIEQGAKIDFFAYSIGSLLAQILLMTDPGGRLSQSRLFNFCGGPILTRTSPVSRYILDSEANIAVYSFFIEHLEAEIKKDGRLAHYFGDRHPVGRVFRCMLDPQMFKEFREQRLKEISSRVMAVALKKDKVIPAYEIVNTLKGDARKIPTKVKILDFPYDYDHVVPFPANDNIKNKVDKSFKKVFKYAAKFLN